VLKEARAVEASPRLKGRRLSEQLTALLSGGCGERQRFEARQIGTSMRVAASEREDSSIAKLHMK